MSTSDTDEVLRMLSSAYAGIPHQFEVDVEDVKRVVAARRRRSRLGAVVVGVAAVAAIGGVSWSQLSQPDQPPVATATSVVVRSGSALETSASSSARDWVRGADLVAVVEVTDERRGTETSAGDGTGDKFVDRSVTLDVDRPLWSRGEGPSADAGESLEVAAAGWIVHADGSTARLALDGQPRLEIGHTYVVALVGTVCTTDTTGATSWSTLGSDAVLPADSSRIGYGESEGRVVAGNIDQTTPESLEQQLIGKTPDALAREIEAAAKAAAPLGSSATDRGC